MLIMDRPQYQLVPALAGQVAGEEGMKAEIAARGPIACGICVTPEFEAYAGGIYNDSRQCTEEMHVIAVEGYGEENGVPYWLARNRSAALFTPRAYTCLIHAHPFRHPWPQASMIRDLIKGTWCDLHGLT